jgi:holo-[acyl-carrier protein] synthase
VDLPAGVIGVGVDLVDTERFARVIERSPRLVTRVFTPREIEQCGGRPASLAVRWAAKEAVAKVLVDNRGHRWHDCEVVSGERGEPVLLLHGTVRAAAQARGANAWHLSLSHDGSMAVAFVVASRA